MKNVTKGDKVKGKVVNDEEGEYDMMDDASDSSLAEIPKKANVLHPATLTGHQTRDKQVEAWRHLLLIYCQVHTQLNSGPRVARLPQYWRLSRDTIKDDLAGVEP